MTTTRLTAAFLAVLVLAGCAADDPHRRAKTGAAIGAVSGAVLGHQLDDEAGKFVGAAVGAVAGAAVGNYMDKQEQAFEQALAQERRQHAAEVQRLKDDTLKLTLSNEVSFDFDSAQIKPAFKPTLREVAGVLREYPKSVVHIVGHTDNVGPADYNQRLSQRRAEAVKQFLVQQGISGERIRAEGRGESDPRATNETASGRQLNRRVEIYVKPVVEGEEERAYRTPGG